MEQTSAVEQFLLTDLSDPKRFRIAFTRAAYTLVADQNGVTLDDVYFDGAGTAERDLSSTSLYPIDDLSDEPMHLRATRVLAQWENQGGATFFRGARLPDARSSFGSDLAHASPDARIAIAYGSGEANGDTGLGRVLPGIGFLSSFKTQADTPTYSNFGHEDATTRDEEGRRATVADMAQSVRGLVRASQDDPHLFARAGDCISEGEKRLGVLTGKGGHYEVMVETKSAESLHLISNQRLYRVDLDNPRWQAVLGRAQEALLRDFYEINPLDDALTRLKWAAESQQLHDQPTTRDLVTEVESQIQEERQRRIAAPFEARCLADVSLGGSTYAQQRPYMTESRRVGSGTSAETRYPTEIETLRAAVSAISDKDFERASALMAGHMVMQNKIVSTSQHPGRPASHAAKPGTHLIGLLRSDPVAMGKMAPAPR